MIEGPQTRGEEIIGTILVSPSLIEATPDLKVSDFMCDDEKNLFSEIIKQWEDMRQIDQFILGQKTPGGQSYLQRIQTGVTINKKPEAFIRDVRELKKEKHQRNIFRLFEAQRNIVKKSGGVVNFEIDKVQAEIDAIRALDEGRERRSVLDMANFSGIRMEPVEWLWYPVAPFGMVGTVLGNPGVGKSFLLTDLAARISSGRDLPVYRKSTGKTYKGWVIYITSEGVPDKILKPRLYAAAAAMENVTLVKGIYNEEKEFQVLDVRYHLPLLLGLIRNEREAKKGNCVLVIIDPIASFVSGKANLNDSVQARHALDAIARFAEEASVAVLVAVHPNKDETKRIMARAAGSMQMSAAVKTAWIVAEPKDDDPLNMRYFAPYKIQTVEFNKNEALPFYLDEANFKHDGKFFEMARIRWSEKTVKCDIEKIISPRADEGLPQAAKVRAWLKEKLKDGSRLARDLYAAAEDEGFTNKQLWHAKDALGVQLSVDGFQGPKVWYLPEDFKE
jgi:hypothetical protein